MAAAPGPKEASHLPPDDAHRPGDVEPDNLIARRHIENVRALWQAEARLLYRAPASVT